MSPALPTGGGRLPQEIIRRSQEATTALAIEHSREKCKQDDVFLGPDRHQNKTPIEERERKERRKTEKGSSVEPSLRCAGTARPHYLPQPGSSIERPIGRWTWSASAPAPTAMLIWTTLLDWSNRLEVPVAPFLARCFQRQRLLPVPHFIRGKVDRVKWLSHLNMIHHCQRCKMGAMPSWLTCQAFFSQVEGAAASISSKPGSPCMTFPFAFAEIFSTYTSMNNQRPKYCQADHRLGGIHA